MVQEFFKKSYLQEIILCILYTYINIIRGLNDYEHLIVY